MCKLDIPCFDYMCDECQAEADKGTEMEWISVKDKLPEENVKVLAYLRERGCVINYTGIDFAWYYEKEGWWHNYLSPSIRVTHWMPLPDPPESDDKQCPA